MNKKRGKKAILTIAIILFALVVITSSYGLFVIFTQQNNPDWSLLWKFAIFIILFGGLIYFTSKLIK